MAGEERRRFVRSFFGPRLLYSPSAYVLVLLLQHFAFGRSWAAAATSSSALAPAAAGIYISAVYAAWDVFDSRR